MLVAERHQKIGEIINNKGSIRVSELSTLFGVTEETIRRDLEKLENEGILQRSHGGAVSVRENQTEVPYFEREITNVEEKKAIAHEALNYIQPSDRIILDASTTAWYMAKILPDIPLTVLTNSIKVSMELANKEKIEVISTGGILQSRSLSFVGPLTEQSLSFYHVNKAFISCKGIHLDHGISDTHEMQALLKRKMIDISDQVYVMVDYSKFEKRAFTRITSLNAIDLVITDAQTDSKHIQQLKELSVEVNQIQVTDN